MVWRLLENRVRVYLIRVNVLYKPYTYIMEGKAAKNRGLSLWGQTRLFPKEVSIKQLFRMESVASLPMKLEQLVKLMAKKKQMANC